MVERKWENSSERVSVPEREREFMAKHTLRDTEIISQLKNLIQPIIQNSGGDLRVATEILTTENATEVKNIINRIQEQKEIREEQMQKSQQEQQMQMQQMQPIQFMQNGVMPHQHQEQQQNFPISNIILK